MISGKEWASMGGALVAGLGASVCCIGPVLLVSLGLGGAAFAVAFEPYRPWLIGVTVLLLGISFYLVYRPSPSEACGPDGECTEPSRRTGLKVLLWTVTVLVLAALTFPYYVEYIV